MKSAAAVLLAAATLAVAKPQHALPTGAAINCARANANYCMGEDLILRCDGSATGTPVHCADELKNKGSPNDAVTCRQSNLEAGDGACVKGCVVYAASSSYTLPAGQCTGAPTGTMPGSSSPSGSPSTPDSSPVSKPKPTSTPNGCPAPTKPATTTPVVSVPGSSVPVSSRPASTSPAKSSPPPSVPTGAASSNQAAGCLALVGMIAAYFL